MAPFFWRGYEPATPDLTRPGKKVHRLKIPSRLLFHMNDEEGRKVRFEGEYPRRVVAGEILAWKGKLAVLAPTDGLARLDQEQKLLVLRPEGTLGPTPDSPLAQKEQLSPLESDPEKCISLLNRAGMVSQDFAGFPFAELLERVLQDSHPVAVISNYDTQGAIDWKALGFGQDEMRELGNWLSSIFPDGKKNVIFFAKTDPLWVPAGLQSYRSHLPFIIAKKALGKSREVISSMELHRQGVLFIGPETAFALLEWLRSGQPALRKLVAVRYERKFASKHLDGETHLFRIPGGYPLSDFLEEIKTGIAGSKVVSGNIFLNGVISDQVSDDATLDLHGPGVYYVFPESLVANKIRILPCNGCMLCDRICPVGAGPFGIISDGSFNKENCLHCGLCDYVCESNIPLVNGGRKV